MRCRQLTLIVVIASVLTVTSPVGALVTGSDYGMTTSTVRDAAVVLGAGIRGFSSLSSTSDYGVASISAGLEFNEISDATVSALVAPSLDGSASNAYSSQVSGYTGGFDTSTANDIIYVVVSIHGANSVSSVTNIGTALSWSQRGAVADGSNERLETWYAVNPSSGATNVTVTFDVDTSFVVTAFGISGANTGSPFDSEMVSLGTGNGSGTSQTVAVSTANLNDFVIGAVAVSVLSGNAPAPQAGTGFASVASSSVDSIGGMVEYDAVTTLQNSTPVTSSTSPTSVRWAMISDAIQGTLPSIANDTALSSPSSSGSFALAGNSSAFLWGPAYPSAVTICSGSWLLDLWASVTSVGSLEVLFAVVNSSNIVTRAAASGLTGTVGLSKSEVVTNFSGSTVNVPSGGRLVAILTNSLGESTVCTIYWGTGQVTHFQTPGNYDYVLTLVNSEPSSYTVSLSVYGSSSIDRITEMAVILYSPSTTELVITNGVLSQASGPAVALQASSTLYMSISVSADAFGSSSMVFLVLISPGGGPLACDVVALEVN